MTTPATIPVACPVCGKALRRLPLLREATEQYTRTCAPCEQRWRLLVKPRGIKGGILHSVTFTAIGR